MSGSFRIIAITAPYGVESESERITRILQEGEADIVHLRKPDWDIDAMRRLIEKIPDSLHCRIRIHSHFSLASEYGLGGIHLNSRNPVPLPEAGNVSISFHSVEQLADAVHYDYVTLSPVFDSISKPGYSAAFNLERLKPFIQGKRVIALGGVTPDKFPVLRDAGFFGAAMLGYFWNELK